MQDSYGRVLTNRVRSRVISVLIFLRLRYVSCNGVIGLGMEAIFGVVIERINLIYVSCVVAS